MGCLAKTTCDFNAYKKPEDEQAISHIKGSNIRRRVEIVYVRVYATTGRTDEGRRHCRISIYEVRPLKRSVFSGGHSSPPVSSRIMAKLIAYTRVDAFDRCWIRIWGHNFKIVLTLEGRYHFTKLRRSNECFWLHPSKYFMYIHRVADKKKERSEDVSSKLLQPIQILIKL